MFLISKAIKNLVCSRSFKLIFQSNISQKFSTDIQRKHLKINKNDFTLYFSIFKVLEFKHYLFFNRTEAVFIQNFFSKTRQLELLRINPIGVLSHKIILISPRTPHIAMFDYFVIKHFPLLFTRIFHRMP